MWHPLEGKAPKGERTWNKLSGLQAVPIWAENFSAPSLEAQPESPYQLPPPSGTSLLSRWSRLTVFSSETCKCHGNGARQSRWQGFPSVRQKLEEHKLQVTWFVVDTCSIFLLQITLHEWARLGSHQGIQFEKYFHGFPLSMTSVYGIISWWFRAWALESSIQFSRSVVSDSLQHYELQHARPPCPSPTPGVHPDSCPSSWWCHPAISSSVIPFSSCPQSLPASASFPMSQLFTWDGQGIGVSALASVLPMNTQDWSPLGWTGWISLQSKGL